MISVHALYEDCTGNDRQVAVGEEGDLNDGAPWTPNEPPLIRKRECIVVHLLASFYISIAAGSWLTL